MSSLSGISYLSKLVKNLAKRKPKYLNSEKRASVCLILRLQENSNNRNNRNIRNNVDYFNVQGFNRNNLITKNPFPGNNVNFQVDQYSYYLTLLLKLISILH